MTKRYLFGAVALLLLASCGEDAPPATEIVVYVDAEPGVRNEAERVVVAVSGRDPGEPFVVAEELTFDPDELPLQFPVAPDDGDVERQWEVRAQAVQVGGDVLAEQRFMGDYVEGESRVLYVILREACLGVSCSGPQTCDRGDCVPTMRTAESLPEYTGGRVPAPPAPTGCADDDDCPDDGVYCNGPRVCAPGAAGADAQGCVDGAPPCDATSCDEGTETCSCVIPDADADGFDARACGGDDCDDGDASSNPDAGEDPEDGADNDCDGTIDESPCPNLPENSDIACADLCDNDGDGGIDCADPDCMGVSVCMMCPPTPQPERSDAACSDGCDTDGDGFTDCDDFSCHEFASCGAVCSCESGEDCLTRRPYAFAGDCGQRCRVGSDATGDMSSWGPSRGDCPSGQTCWWRGIAGDDSGVCATSNDTAMTPMIGAGCSGHGACGSPFGLGRCLNAFGEGFPGGYCTIVDCAAPGLPGTPSLICGPNNICAQLGSSSYCLRGCSGNNECRTGYGCRRLRPSDPTVCVPLCSGPGSCGTNGTCTSDGFCLPPSEP